MLSSILLSLNVSAQDFSSILKSIEENSPRLEAARMRSDAEKADTRVETALEDPEAGVNYLWGTGESANRLDINFSQTFDFPTVIVQKRRFAKEQRRVADLKFLDARQELLLSAKKLCIEVVYCNAIMNHIDDDLAETQAVADAYQKMYEKGEATIIDRNKAHQAVLMFHAEYRELHAMRDNLLAELKCLNGGKDVVITDTAFTHTPLEKNFEEWLANHIEAHSAIRLAKGNVTTEESALKLARKEWAPKLKVGYMSEVEKDGQLHGVSFGLSVPLWSGKRKVNAAKAHLAAAQMEEKETYCQIETQLRGIYNDALQLQETVSHFSKHIHGCDNTPHLDKLLDSGKITLLDYMQECQFVHEMYEKLLIAERDFKLRMAELSFGE